MTNNLNEQKKEIIILYLRAHCPKNDRVEPLMVMSVGRVLLKEISTGNDLEDLISSDEIRHIYDWLVVETNHNSSWLSNIDDKQRPKKLMKFSSIEQIVKEADKAMMITNQQIQDIWIDSEDETVIANLNDNYRLIKMLTPSALDKESKYMQHCIGQGAYDDLLNDEDCLFLSLRDSRNKPHVTLDIVKNDNLHNILQIKGKQNKTPKSKYLEILRPWLKDNNARLRSFPDSELFVSSSEELYHGDHLPEKFITKGDFRTKYITGKLPTTLIVKGSCFLKNDKGNIVPVLPEKLKVKETLVLSNDFKKIHDNTYVGASLLTSNSEIEEIGENCVIIKDCNLSESKITKMPNKIFVGEILNISGLQISELGENTEMSSLDAEGSSLIALPDRKKHYDQLKISITKVSKLPEGLEVDHLSADYLTFSKMPENLTVKNFLSMMNCKIPLISSKWNLPHLSSFCGSEIDEIEGDIKFHDSNFRYTDFSSTIINKMPNSITCEGGSINFRNSKINDLPKLLNVTETIDLSHIDNLLDIVHDAKLECNQLIITCPLVIPKNWKINTVCFKDDANDKLNILSLREYNKFIIKHSNENDFKP